MGVYLTIKSNKKTNAEANKLNKLWIEFADEEEEKEYKENFYGDRADYTLHFNTDKDNLEHGIYFRDEQGKDIGNEVGCRYDLGFYPEMSDLEAKKKYIEVFKIFTELGHCELKLSSDHYCYHTLRKVREFLKKYDNMLTWDDEDNGKNLDDYCDPKIWGKKIFTSRYCKICKEQSNIIDIRLPIYPNERCKNIVYNGDGIFKTLMKIALNVPD